MSICRRSQQLELSENHNRTYFMKEFKIKIIESLKQLAFVNFIIEEPTCSGRSQENIVLIRASVVEQPNLSSSRH